MSDQMRVLTACIVLLPPFVVPFLMITFVPRGGDFWKQLLVGFSTFFFFAFGLGLVLTGMSELFKDLDIPPPGWVILLIDFIAVLSTMLGLFIAVCCIRSDNIKKEKAVTK